MAKVKAITKQGTNNPLSDLLRQLNWALRGWTTYFRHGVSKATFCYLGNFTWHRVRNWLRRKHSRATWRFLQRRYLANNGSWTEQGGEALFKPEAVPVTRYRYRGTKIPTPWDEWAATVAG
jgi:RNA-directed DNA polymerase